MTARALLSTTALAATLAASLQGAVSQVPATAPLVDSASVERVEITFARSAGVPTEVAVVTRDAAAIAALAALVNGARPAPDHKCRDAGTVVFRLVGGAVVTLGTLAGHRDDRWELRLRRDGGYDVLSIDREALATLLESLGVCRSVLGGAPVSHDAPGPVSP